MAIFRNSILNLLGSIIPAAVALPVLGYMARALDPALFGAAMLIWAIVGYAGVFDAGLGKAVVRQIALYNIQKNLHGLVIGSSLFFVIGSGLVAAVAVFASADYIGSYFFKLDAMYHAEGTLGIKFAAICIPLFLMTLVLQSYLEGIQNFKLFNIFRSVSGVLNYLIPLIMYLCFYTFSSFILGLLISRFISLAIIFYFINRISNCRSWIFDIVMFKQLVAFGGWLTITNLISPLMVYMDKFIISKVSGAAGVAFYAAPSELINRMTVFPVAVSRAVFPRLSSLGSGSGFGVKKTAFILTGSIVLPLILILFVLSPYVIKLWLGEEYVSMSSPIFKIMLIGFFFNSLALISYNSLQAAGRSKLTAIIHLCEVIPYLTLLFWSVSHLGVIGGAIVWTARMVIDFLVMLYFDSRGA